MAWRQDIAQLHQPSAGLASTALAGWRQREHLGEASLMGDQITVEQFVAGLDQGRQRHSQQCGQRAVAVERQRRACRPRRSGRSTSSTASRDRCAACSRRKRRSTQDQPVCGGRRSRAGTRMGVCGMLELLKGKQTAPANQRTAEHAIIDDRRRLGRIVTPAVAATVAELRRHAALRKARWRRAA